jgi:predicted hydrolase (HD superfamily)
MTGRRGDDDMFDDIKRILFSVGVGLAAVAYIIGTRKARANERNALTKRFTEKGYDAQAARHLSHSVSDRDLRGQLQQRGWLRD